MLKELSQFVPEEISYLGMFVLWDKIYPINGVIRSNTQKKSYKCKHYTQPKEYVR